MGMILNFIKNFIEKRNAVPPLSNSPYAPQTSHTVLKSRSVFDGFSDDIHKSEEQQTRIRHADSPFIHVLHLNPDGRSGTVVGDSGEAYQTSFSSCTCEDFSRRLLPCKHMYKLAIFTKRFDPDLWYDGGHIFANKNIIPERDFPHVHGHNMSMNLYSIKAVYIPTGRIRSFTLEAYSENDAINQIGKSYRMPPVLVDNIDYNPPSERQLFYAIYLGIEIPEKCCVQDLSCIIDQGGAASVPQPLISFAKQFRLNYSLYSNEERLTGILFYHLSADPVKQTAFLIAAMKKHLLGTWDFTEWQTWSDFSEHLLKTDVTFCRSLKRIQTGFHGFGLTDAPSKSTALYKTIYGFLTK